MKRAEAAVSPHECMTLALRRPHHRLGHFPLVIVVRKADRKVVEVGFVTVRLEGTHHPLPHPLDFCVAAYQVLGTLVLSAEVS